MSTLATSSVPTRKASKPQAVPRLAIRTEPGLDATARCTEMASFLAENRRACARLGRYRATLEGLAGDFPGGLPVAAVAERT